MGLPFGNIVRAMRSLMMATFGDVAVSCGPKLRPASKGICKAEKYPLVMTLCFTFTSEGFSAPAT